MARQVALLLCLLLSACQNWPDSYPPPAQSPRVDPPPITAEPSIIDLGAPDTDSHIVRDVWVGRSQSPWRWTEKRPLLKLQLHGTVGLKFIVDYSVPEATFKDTGPVHIAFFVNGRMLATVAVENPGRKYFEKPAPESWLHPAAENTVGAEIDKLWTDPLRHDKYGFILSEIGFTRIGTQP
ncbi:MAG: hypothetical protein ABI165_11935 [Bryobacteraceae bacterium]